MKSQIIGREVKGRSAPSRRLTRRWAAVTMIAALVTTSYTIAVSPHAVASPTNHRSLAIPAKSSSLLLSATAPPGYQVVSKAITVPSGGNFGSITCPTNAWPSSGGGVVASAAGHIASSFPSGRDWWVFVSNPGGLTNLTIYAVCLLPTLQYSVQRSTQWAIPHFGQTAAIAQCPPGTFVHGGGIESDSSNAAVNVNSSYPSGNGWKVYVNNGSSSDASFRVDAVCDNKPAGYSFVVGANEFDPIGTNSIASVSCTGKFPLGGGGFSDSVSTFVNMNGSRPSGNGWEVHETNASTSDARVSARVICVG